MATLDQKSPNVLLQSLCCRITGKSEAEVAHQFQYAVRVIGSNYAPSIERDEFLVSEKIKKELLKQRREADAALFSELHRKLQTQGVLKHRWSVLYLLLSLSEDPRKPSSRVGNYGALFAQALQRDAHSTPFYCTRPQSLALSYGERSAGLSASVGTSGISSLGVYTLNGPTPTPQSLLAGQPPPSAAAGGQPLGSRLAWALPVSSSPSSALAPPANRPLLGPPAPSARVVRPRRDGDGTGEVSEALLVRDILYVFQGIDGKFIKMSAQDNCYKIDSKVSEPASRLVKLLIDRSAQQVAHITQSDLTEQVVLCKSLRDTSSRLAELGWLHNKVRKYTDARSLDRAFGLVGQSFCSSLHQELKEYYRLLSVLHSQLQVEDDQGVTVCTESTLTLRRLLVWMYDPKVRLKTLAALVDFCQGRKGGELASAVHAYGKTGDPQMRALVQHILSLVSHPILNFLYRWIYDGELEDTYHEVLLIGKSINFLHQVCHDRTPPGKITSASKSADTPKDGRSLSVFTRECMGHYLRVFNFLWRAKRMEYTLTDIWKGQMCNAKLLKTMPELSGVLHQCHILASEMVHFIHQMQYYITFEVLECSWDELWNKVQQAQDLDHIIAAHDVFLDTIISRCLLDNNSRGQWGVTAEQEAEEKKRIQDFQETIPKMRSQLRILTHFYQSIVQQFLVLLMTSSDESLRFLSFRLDFNEHYRFDF
eukprot:superscaffoldBa00002774_g15249